MTQKLRYFCTLLLVAVASVAWADEETIDFTAQGYENAQAVTETTGTVVKATFTNGGTPTAYYTTGEAVRVYNGGTMSITANGNTITKIEYTYVLNGAATATVAGKNSEGTYDSGTKTWTGSDTEVVLTAGTAKHVRISQVVVTYTAGDTDAPSISADNVNIAYDATEGAIAYTINNPATGGSLTADTDSEWLLLDDNFESPIAFLCDANNGAERTATVTLTYTYDNETVTKNVTVTQAAAPVIYTTIPDLFAAATSTATDVNVQFNNWVVTGVSPNGRNVFVTDGTNGFAIYDGSGSLASTYAVGNTLAGLASCKLKLQNGYAQLQDVNAADLTIGTGGSVDFATITMADLAGVNTGALVQYDNLTCSVDNNKYYLTDGTTTIQVYTTLYSDLANSLEDGKIYNITGVYQQYNTTKEILPRDENDIEEVIPTEPTVTVNPTAVEVDAAEHDGTITVSCENMGENLDISVFFCEETDVTAPADYDWIDAEIDNQNNVYYVIEANTATEARKAYMVVKVADADAKEVYTSKLITFTQEGFSAIRNFTFEQTSATDGTLTNEPEGVTAVFNNTYTNNKEQLTKDNSMTLTIKGMPANYKVTGITLTVKNNASKGNGTATVSIGKKEIGTFNVTGLGNTYGDQIVTITPSFATSDLIINIAATENSVYCKKFTIEYEIMDYVGVTIKEGFTATTFSCDKALDFSNVEGITANIITDENGLTKPVEKVPAGKGLYIVGAEGDYEVPFLANESEADPVTGNKLTPTDGTTEFKSDESVTYYVFGKQNGKEAFYKVPTSGYTPSANKAVLVVNAPESNAKEMIVIGGDVTGIESIENGTIVNDNYYTIDGKLVKGQPTQKGIYVVNGRKVVIK